MITFLKIKSILFYNNYNLKHNINCQPLHLCLLGQKYPIRNVIHHEKNYVHNFGNHLNRITMSHFDMKSVKNPFSF